MAKNTNRKSIPKFQRSRHLILFCRGPKSGKKCGYAVELCRYTAHWKTCPLCGGTLFRIWHYTGIGYQIDEEPEPYPNNYRRNNRTR